jgi:hypothetical protein
MGDHTLTVSISLPRSMSTTLVRLMGKIDDAIIVHEPAVNLFYNNDFSTNSQTWPTLFKTFKDVKDKILEILSKNNVFLKEMSFTAKSYLADWTGIHGNTGVYYIFLVRDPHNTIVSLYKKTTRKIGEDFSYKDLYELFLTLNNKAINRPIVISAEYLASYPRETIEIICQYTGREFKREYLEWEDESSEFRETDLYKSELCYFSKYWHYDVVASTGFHTLTSYAVSNAGQPTFEEIEDPHEREGCQTLYNREKPYYDQIIKFARNIF